jgi:RimJ/RimL family protein N-acetyltransferase
MCTYQLLAIPLPDIDVCAQNGDVIEYAIRKGARKVGHIVVGPRAHVGAELRLWIDPAVRGRGIARAVLPVAADHALASGLHRLEMLTDVPAVAAHRLALRAGFRREGIRRGAEMVDGRQIDVVLWGRLSGEAAPYPPTLPDLPGGTLTDGVVTLVPVTAADVPRMIEHLQDPDVVAGSVPPTPWPVELIERRCVVAQLNWLTEGRAELSIRDSASGAFAGFIQLRAFGPGGEGMIGYNVSPAWRNRGFATRAARLLADWALHHAGFARIVATTEPNNLASQRVLLKSMFIREARRHGTVARPDGTRSDDLLFVRLRDGGN